MPIESSKEIDIKPIHQQDIQYDINLPFYSKWHTKDDWGINYWDVQSTNNNEEDATIGKYMANKFLAWMKERNNKNEIDAIWMLSLIVEGMPRGKEGRTIRNTFFDTISEWMCERMKHNH